MSAQMKLGATPPGPVPDTTGMSDDEFLRAIVKRNGADPSDVMRTRDQIAECLRERGEDPSDWRRIMLAMA